MPVTVRAENMLETSNPTLPLALLFSMQLISSQATHWSMMMLTKTEASAETMLYVPLLKQQGNKSCLVSLAGREDGSVAMEELCLLLRLAAHVLADPGEGETPMIPLPMIHASQASLAAGQVTAHAAPSSSCCRQSPL